jgi:hypothetical protein
MTGNRLAALIRRCAAGEDEEIVVQLLVARARRADWTHSSKPFRGSI